MGNECYYKVSQIKCWVLQGVIMRDLGLMGENTFSLWCAEAPPNNPDKRLDITHLTDVAAIALPNPTPHW